MRALLAGGDAEAGEAYLHQLSEVHANLYQPYYLLALSQALRGEHEHALTSAEKAYVLGPWSTATRGLFGGLLRSTGPTTRADQLHDGLVSPDQYGTAMGLSLFYMGCSEIETAAHWAEKAAEQRDTRTIPLIALLRAFRPEIFHSNSKWSAIARALGIPSAVREG